MDDRLTDAMAYTNINSEDRLVQATFAEHLEKVLGWENFYAWNDETFGTVNVQMLARLSPSWKAPLFTAPSPKRMIRASKGRS